MKKEQSAQLSLFRKEGAGERTNVFIWEWTKCYMHNGYNSRKLDTDELTDFPQWNENTCMVKSAATVQAGQGKMTEQLFC